MAEPEKCPQCGVPLVKDAWHKLSCSDMSNKRPKPMRLHVCFDKKEKTAG